MRATLGCLMVLLLQGCALFSKGEVATRRYYSADLTPPPPGQSMRNTGVELRLGRVTANRMIGEPMMYRQAEHEVGFYDDRVWTERPEAYLRRGLTRVLFEEQGLKGIVAGPGPTLDVELVRFEEVMTPVHVARVRIALSLFDDRTVLLQETMSFDRPISATTAEQAGPAIAQAMGEALRDAMTQLSTRVVDVLAK